MSDETSTRPASGDAGMAWRYRGTPHYLERQGDRLGVSRPVMYSARHNPEIYRISVLLGHLHERHRRAAKAAGIAALSSAELAQVRGTLVQCERELEKLHALAAAADEMLGEAYAAFGLAAPGRGFGVELRRRAAETLDGEEQ